MDAKSAIRPGVFLTADWKHLVMLNYAVDPALLERFVPHGTELDIFAGNTYVSLVAFEFNNTRIAGLAVPFHGSFEEVNLRFYVKRGERRGVTFVRELVPKRAVAAMARRFFNENYSCVPMSHRIREKAKDGLVRAEFFWGTDAVRCSIRVEAAAESYLPPEGSHAQFITEHYWGYAARPDGGCIEYEVQHPRWRIQQSNAAEFRGDAESYYGTDFAAALAKAPDSAFFIEGSAVTVFRGLRIH